MRVRPDERSRATEPSGRSLDTMPIAVRSAGGRKSATSNGRPIILDRSYATRRGAVNEDVETAVL
jgi:hypothetical protein